jgi:manganese/zinc/iron transport system permease protein
MEDFLRFFSFSDPNIRYVVLGSLFLSAASALVGAFTFLRKRALVGDAIAHAVLPGVCAAFLWSGTKNTLLLVIGAFVTGWLAVYVLEAIRSHSRIKEDAATGIVLSVFFGIGIFLLTIIQNSGMAEQSGLDSFLFGKAASMLLEDVVVFGSIGLLLLICILLFYKELMLYTFDPAFARASGLPVRSLELLLTTLTVLAVVVGIQAVGVVLMAAMLITPAAAARFWTDRLKIMLLLAAFFGAFSGLSGAYISYLAPSMPTGPWIVVVLSTLALFSFFLAPQKGILYKVRMQRSVRNKIIEENVLKMMYQLGEANSQFDTARSLTELAERRHMVPAHIRKILQRLRKQGFLSLSPQGYAFTSAGLRKGQRIVRLHRLWEVYLTTYVRLAPDHVHEDAETIEHILTPELEKRLEKLLEYPDTDPHQSKIPYA